MESYWSSGHFVSPNLFMTLSYFLRGLYKTQPLKNILAYVDHFEVSKAASLLVKSSHIFYASTFHNLQLALLAVTKSLSNTAMFFFFVLFLSKPNI